ncbi:hypothetical protein ACTZWW_07345 [Salinarimonas sp. NSM]
MRAVLAAVLLTVAGAASADEPFPVTQDPVPPDWSGPVFDPSFDFPAQAPADTTRPWDRISFREQPEAFLQAVLDYAYDGMDRETWDGATNEVRRWYHAPWLHTGRKGREFVRGLTRERSSRLGDPGEPNELGELQSRCYQNWAVSLADPAAGWVFGRVWGDGTRDPRPQAARFPVGATFVKLLFTEAPADELALLVGAPEWTANIHVPVAGSTECPPFGTVRAPQTLRLLQFDVAVRVPETDDPTIPRDGTPTGWVYGTFVYDGSMPDADPWRRLRPIGLMWGNDPGSTDGAAGERKPLESIILSKAGFDRDFGRGGRMNGPVDNPDSACLSCHQTAQYPAGARVLPPFGATPAQVACWFRNLEPGEAFGDEPGPDGRCGVGMDRFVSMDTSLQLALGLQNWSEDRNPQAGRRTFRVDGDGAQEIFEVTRDP